MQSLKICCRMEAGGCVVSEGAMTLAVDNATGRYARKGTACTFLQTLMQFGTLQHCMLWTYE
jgi:hypothetical protein